ncbi:hypothetical protein KAR91_75615 [Candidatus Pacearchaeota archaeon]|nr:hypothetical protein [Candidatus Pacearchaeota archaeon]
MEDLYSPGERIGEYMVRIGALTPQQVEEITKKQDKEPNKMFGEIAIELGYINDKAIDEYIKSKGIK